MAAAITQLANPIGSPNTKILVDTAVTNSVIANATGSGATTLYHLEFDNTANSAVTYLKIYESVSPTMGGSAATDEPSLVIAAAASTKEYVSLPTSMVISTGFSYIATTTLAEAGSPAAPSTACSLAVIYTHA